MRRCRFFFSLGAWLLLLPTAGGQENLQAPSLSPSKTILSPQPFVGNEPSAPVSRDLKAQDIDLEIRTPPRTKVSILTALRSESNENQTRHHFRISSAQSSPEIWIEGPFGGRIDAELRLGKDVKQSLEIEQSPLLAPSSNPDPASLKALPALCPRLASSKEGESLSPKTAVYDGSRDWMALSQKSSNALYLIHAELNFDFEDPSILIAMNPQTREWIFEKEGGFYSNLHYAVFPYNENLKALLEKMEPDLSALRALEKRLRDKNFEPGELMEMQKLFQKLQASLYGRGRELGPYQILMNLIFGTLASTPVGERAHDFPSPVSRGFVPGPFLGSVHFSYPLCEWGDTSRQAPQQVMNYIHFPLWTWSGTEGADEKKIIILLEGDEQLKKNPSRLSLEKSGALRSFDYADDLIGYFIVDREETLVEKKLTTPFDFLSLEVKTE